MRTSYFLLLTSSFAVFAQAQTAQLRWDVQQDRPVAHDVQVWQGETVDLMPRLVQGTLPVAVTNAPVEFRYREASLPTNTCRVVSAASNTNSGVLAVRWLPDYDAGAAWYDYQFIVGSNAANPRAFGRITMRPTIGWPASANPPPPVTLYPSRADLQATSNALAEAVQAESETNALFNAWFGSLFNSTSRWDSAAGWGDWHSAVALKLDITSTNGWETGSHAGLATTGSVFSIFGDMLAHLTDYAETNRVTRWYDPELPSRWAEWDGGTNIVIYLTEVSGTNLTVTLSDDFLAEDGTRPAWTNNAWPFDDGMWRGVVFEMGGDPWYSMQKTGAVRSWDAYPSNPVQYPLILSTFAPAMGTATVSSHCTFATNIECRYYLPTNAIPPELSNLDLLQAWLNNLYATKQDLVSATNVIIQTYLISSNAWLIADFSNQTVSVSMVSTNGTTNTVSIGSGNGNAIDPLATNLLWLALNAGLAGKAPKAWGQYAPDGSANPEPEFMTFLNAPATVFASGAQWSTYGTNAVLTATGTVAFASGGDGQFRLGPNSTNWFGFVQGGSVTVGAVAESLAVAAGGTAEGIATIVYPYSGGDFPALWFSPSLGTVDFATVEGVVWVDNQNGTATVTAPATTAKGFWYATTTATFGNVFESTMPARFSGGVFGDTNSTPVIYNSVITIESGGHTYRLPAQLTN